MTDLQKRETLKRITAAGVSSALVSAPLLAALDTPTSTTVSGFPQPVRGVSDLDIRIIATTSVPGSTAVFTNMTEHELVVRHFLPGTIVFGDRRVDLNGVPANPVLRIEPFGVASRPVQVTPVDSGDLMEYVWADDALSSISEFTDVITLGAFAADQRLIVYPVPTLSVPA